MILKAEALDSSWVNMNSVQTAYDNAINAAAELLCVLCHHKVLANERAGLYLANKATRQPEASLIYLAHHAMRLYEK